MLSEIQNYCNNAAIIKEGEIIATDSVSNLTKTNARKILLRGVTKIPELKGVVVLKEEKDSVSFMYQGKIKVLLTLLNEMELKDVIIEEPSLEEIFLHYYEKAGETI